MIINKHIKKCLVCIKLFVGDRKKSKFCSSRCSGISCSKNAKRINVFTKNCIICTKEYITRDKNRRACSQPCRGIMMRKNKIYSKCSLCKKEFISKQKAANKFTQFCSSKCYGASMVNIKKGPSLWEIMTHEEQINHLKKSFNKRVIKQEGCWDTIAGKSKAYGSIQYQNKSISLHRASWIIHKGTIPKGMFVCHTCDNPRCSNPNHLFLGTPTDNVHDMIKKGRRKICTGEQIHGAKLKEQDVIFIKQQLAQNISIMEMAKQFNVAYRTIHDIKLGKTWKNVKFQPAQLNLF